MPDIPILADETRWRAFVDRDLAAAPTFVIAVKTTGIYCRAGCRSRLPRRENVRFFDTTSQARAAGFRPCKRCRPDEVADPVPDREAIVRACRLLENPNPPTLAALAREVGMSPSQLQRRFRAVVGLTPRGYAMSIRQERYQQALQSSNGVAEAIHEAGFSNTSRGYEAAPEALGMTPGEYRRKGEGLAIRYAFAKTTLGWVIAAATEKGLCFVALDEDREPLATELQNRFGKAEGPVEDPELQGWLGRVVGAIEECRSTVDLPLDIRGTAFQKRVWDALREIPPGETTTYRRIAERIGNPKAVRAVGTACGANHVSIVIPCHRAVREDGGLGGYRWGLERKKTLLGRESQQEKVSGTFFTDKKGS